eukprot:3712220-Rhodomonas_salina.1
MYLKIINTLRSKQHGGDQPFRAFDPPALVHHQCRPRQQWGRHVHRHADGAHDGAVGERLRARGA